MYKLLSIMNCVEDSLNMLSKKWKIDPRVDDLYVLWKCLWPDCHNCCERQGRLPLTKDDLKNIATKMGYYSKSDFIINETRISSWHEHESFGNIITTLTMLSLKRKHNETEE